MSDMYVKRGVFIALMIASFIAGVLFFVTDNINFIIKAVDQNIFFFPNICYAMIRIVSGMLFPLMFIAPSMFEFGQIKLTKVLFIIYGILHLLTLTWIFYFLAENSWSDLLSYRAISLFQRNPYAPFIASRVFWGTTSWAGAFFSIIYSALCIYTGICFDDNRKKVRICVILLVILKIFLPLAYTLITGNGLWSSDWLSHNYLELIAVICYSAAICYASSSDDMWIELVWNQDLPNKEEEDDEDEDFSTNDMHNF